jgi:hypothetical protein
MGQGSYSILPMSRQHPPNMPERQVKHLCCLFPGHMPGDNVVEHFESFLFFYVQCHLFFHKVTFSLNN